MHRAGSAHAVLRTALFLTLRCPRSSVLVTALVVMLSIAGCVERVPAEVCAGVARVAA